MSEKQCIESIQHTSIRPWYESMRRSLDDRIKSPLHSFSHSIIHFKTLQLISQSINTYNFPKRLLSCFFPLCWLWLTTGSCVGPQNKICHPAHRYRRLMQVPVLSAHGKIGPKTCVIVFVGLPSKIMDMI